MSLHLDWRWLFHCSLFNEESVFIANARSGLERRPFDCQPIIDDLLGHMTQCGLASCFPFSFQTRWKTEACRVAWHWRMNDCRSFVIAFIDENVRAGRFTQAFAGMFKATVIAEDLRNLKQKNVCVCVSHVSACRLKRSVAALIIVDLTHTHTHECITVCHAQESSVCIIYHTHCWNHTYIKHQAFKWSTKHMQIRGELQNYHFRCSINSRWVENHQLYSVLDVYFWAAVVLENLIGCFSLTPISNRDIIIFF